MTDRSLTRGASSDRRPFVPPEPPRATLGQSVGRGFALIRYHRPSQLWRRAAKLVRHRAGWDRSAFAPHDRLVSSDIALRDSESATFAPIRARRLTAWGHRLEGWTANLTTRTFRYLNHDHRFEREIDWQIDRTQGVSDLWRFHLQYQDELLAALPEGEDVRARRTASRGLMEEWIEGNPRGRGPTDAWHPFCVSRRLVNWMIVWDAVVPGPPDDRVVRERLLQSLNDQVEFLGEHLEWDLRGNHLLVNLHALGLAAAFLDGPAGQRALAIVERFLPAQLREQLLPWGEHFERSPMYHAQMLEAVLDLRDALTEISPALAAECRAAAVRMADFLAAIRHPDGGIPLLGDSVFDDTPQVEPLLRHARMEDERSSAEHEGASRVGDYWIVRDDDNFALFDTGPVGLDELPAHAHCDLLSFEMSFRGERVFVDAGVFDYEDAPLRRYGRSTAAHNVLQVDEAEQCDVWSKFRMGRRGQPTRRESGETNGWNWCFAAHDAYRSAGVPEVGRWMGCRRGGHGITVETLDGRGTHDVTLRWHLHPAITASLESMTDVRLSLARGSLILTLPAGGACWLEQYPYCPEFGRQLDATVVVWRSRQQLPCRLLWTVRPVETDFSAEIASATSDGSSVFVECVTARERVRIPLPL